jgi:hypothetical protein
MMLWDGRWVETPVQSSPQALAIRQAIVAGVRSAPEHCRIEVMRGPILIGLADPSGTTLLALGSGEWRWGDLAAVAELPTLSPASPQQR